LELRELRTRRTRQGQDNKALSELEAQNEVLEEQLEDARGLLEENVEEIERLRTQRDDEKEDMADEINRVFHASPNRPQVMPQVRLKSATI